MRQALQYKNLKLQICILAGCLLIFLASVANFSVVNAIDTPSGMPSPTAVDGQQSSAGKSYCGDGNQKVAVSVDIGCRGVGGGITNPITDAAFAIIRFLSAGVGLIIVASLTFAGIQYTTSRGDPKATAEAINRIKSNVVAFLIFIFSFAILNYLIPQGFIG